jgi:hypothetical protein
MLVLFALSFVGDELRNTNHHSYITMRIVALRLSDDWPTNDPNAPSITLRLIDDDFFGDCVGAYMQCKGVESRLGKLARERPNNSCELRLYFRSPGPGVIAAASALIKIVINADPKRMTRIAVCLDELVSSTPQGQPLVYLVIDKSPRLPRQR